VERERAVDRQVLSTARGTAANRRSRALPTGALGHSCARPSRRRHLVPPLQRPLPGGRPKPFEPRCTITSMASGAGKIQIPRWIQLVGLPLLLVFLWLVAGAARHVVFLFLVASLIALLLDPIVNAFTSFRLPRGFAVAIVFAAFTAAVILAIAALATV